MSDQDQAITPGPAPPSPDTAVNPLQAQTHREMVEMQAQRHRERLEMWVNFTANGLAFCVVGGFFSICGIALLGYADIRDATVAAFVGTTLGYVVGSIAPISQFYYKMLPGKVEGWIPEKPTATDTAHPPTTTTTTTTK